MKGRDKVRNLFKNKTIGYLLPIMILLFFCQQAQAVQFRSKKKQNNIQSYPWGLQIAFDGKAEENSGDNDYQGIRFSLKRQTSKHTAARINLGFYGHEVDYSQHGLFESGYVSIDLDDNSRFDFTGVNLSFQYLYYPSPDNKFQFFWGAGPRLSVNETDFGIMRVYYNDGYNNYYDEVYSDNTTKLGLGVEAALGSEWFLSKNFSLLAEWGIVLQNEWYFFELDDGYYHTYDNIETVNDGLHLDASRIKLGAAFYF